MGVIKTDCFKALCHKENKEEIRSRRKRLRDWEKKTKTYSEETSSHTGIMFVMTSFSQKFLWKRFCPSYRLRAGKLSWCSKDEISVAVRKYSTKTKNQGKLDQWKILLSLLTRQKYLGDIDFPHLEHQKRTGVYGGRQS